MNFSPYEKNLYEIFRPAKMAVHISLDAKTQVSSMLKSIWIFYSKAIFF